MTEAQINSIIKEAIDENEGEDRVSELNFSEKDLAIGSLTPSMKTAIERCSNVDFLGLSDCQLTSLSNLPNLPKLDTLDLKDNDLNDEELKKLVDLKNLKNLYLEGNKIERIETLEALALILPQLSDLEIDSNPVTDINGYEARIWKAFTSLEVLNQHNKKGDKIEQNLEGDIAGEDDFYSEDEDDYDGAEESEDSEFSEADYDSQNDKPKKKRKTK